MSLHSVANGLTQQIVTFTSYFSLPVSSLDMSIQPVTLTCRGLTVSSNHNIVSQAAGNFATRPSSLGCTLPY